MWIATKDLLEKKDADKAVLLETAPVEGIPSRNLYAFDAATQKRILLGDPEGVKNIPLDIWNCCRQKTKKLSLGQKTRVLLAIV
jgi:hypothetical protein